MTADCQFFIKQNDTSPAWQVTLKDADDNPVDLTGATVRFHMETAEGVNLVDAAATLVDASNGVVKYTWQAGDTANAGVFNAEFEVTYSDSTVETFPNHGYERVRIDRELQ